jgi:hypothetical protein
LPGGNIVYNYINDIIQFPVEILQLDYGTEKITINTKAAKLPAMLLATTTNRIGLFIHQAFGGHFLMKQPEYFQGLGNGSQILLFLLCFCQYVFYIVSAKN